MRYLVFLLLLPATAFTQTLQIEWQACFGGSETDYATDIIEIENGFFLTGNTNSIDGDISINHGFEDGWLIKTDNLGNIIWEKTYGGSHGDGLHNIFYAPDGNYYLVGGSNSSDGDISYDPYPNTLDFWIVIIDSLGNMLCDKIVGGNGHDQLWTGTTTTDGGVVAIGWTNSEDGDVSVHYDMYDIWMVKLNSHCEIEWDFTIGNNYLDFGHAIIQTSDGGFLVGGTSKITEGGNLNCQSHGQADGVLIKLDSLRNIEWQQCYGGSDYDGITAVIEVSEGFVFAGYVNSDDGDITGWHGENDIWVVRIDYFGNIIWQNCLGGSRSEFISKLILNDDGNLIIPGYTNSNDGDITGNHTFNDFEFDIWFITLSSDGELLWQQCIGGDRNESLDFGVIKKNDHDFIIAGQTNFGPSYDVQCGPLVEQFADFWVFEIDSLDTTGAVENHYEQDVIDVYPNPAKEYVEFQVPGSIPPTAGQVGCEVRVVNLFGQEVANLPVKSEKTVWDCREVKTGVYFYFVEQEGKRYSGKVVINKQDF
jgi:hypothetical protein